MKLLEIDMENVTQDVTQTHADAVDNGSEYRFEVSPEDFDRQCKLEEEMGALGAAAYWSEVTKARDSGQASSTRAGQFMLDQLLDRVINHPEKGLLAWIAGVEQGNPSARKPSAYKFIKSSPAEVIAFITLRIVIDKMTRDMHTTPLSAAIGRALEDEARLREYRDELPAYYDAVKKSLDKKTSNMQHKRRVLKGSLETKIEEVFDDWPKRSIINVGIVMLGIIVETTGIVEIKNIRSRGRTTSTVRATEKATDIMKQVDDMSSLMSPLRLPTVIPPRPWINPNSGGYWTPNVRMRLVKAFNRNYLDDLAAVRMDTVYNTVNLLQVTPFRVCQPVLDVMQELYRLNRDDAGLPPSEDREIPAKPVDIDTNEEARGVWRRKASAAYASNARLRGKRIAVVKTMWVADKFKDEDRIYFPKTLDFRGRVYDAPMFLQPQGHDTSKGLLQFADGKPLGENGAFWLAVHIANCYGEDKISLQARADWVLDNTDAILRAAAEPLNDKWWLEADKPFQFLQACLDWAGYVENGDDHISHTAVAMDGSCNGLQNLSAALLDPVGGAAVNLTPHDTPQDIYGIVAKAVAAKVEKDAASGIPSAVGWKGYINRKVCKRPVMTLAYGAKKFGFADQVRTDTLRPWKQDCDDGKNVDAFPFEGDGYEAATYLAGVLWDATGTTVVAAQQVMGWLQETARVAARSGLPLRWHTPAGFPVMQEYKKMNKSRIKTMLMGSRVDLNCRTPDAVKIDSTKMANSIAPNWVHSHDAAHMMLTIDTFSGLMIQGDVALQMVHDSYATHAADTSDLYFSIRRSFADMYSDDVLRNFYEEVASQLPDEIAAELPPPPIRGTLDITKVLESDYFFA